MRLCPVYYFVQCSLLSALPSAESVSWDMMLDCYRSRLELFGFRVIPVHCDGRLPSLIKPEPLLMRVIFHRKDCV